MGGHNLTPLVEVGLTDLPKSGGAMAPPGTTGLACTVVRWTEIEYSGLTTADFFFHKY